MRVKLEDVCERGSSNLKQSDIADSTGDYPIYGASGYIGNVDFYHQEKPYVTVVKDGAGIGRTTLHPAKSSVIGTMQYLLPKENVLPEYLCYVVRYMHLEKYFTGATIPHIYFKDYKNEEFNLDSLDKQAEIITVLGKCERIIAEREQELEKLDELIKARFVELFGDPEENPFGWDKMPLSEVIINANNGMARRGNDEDGNIVMRLVELQDGYIDYSNPNRIILKDNEKKRYLLKDKDFLFARVNGNPDNVGRCAVFRDIGEDVYHNDHIIRVHFNEELLDGTFASALLNSDYGKRQLKSQIKTSAGQYTVSQDGIGAIVTILPSMDKQNQFAEFVAQVDKSKVVIQKALDETQTLFDSLMQEYFG